MTTRKYTYTASVITSIIAADGAELMAFPGAELALDSESERVQTLLAQGHLKLTDGAESPAPDAGDDAPPPTTQSPAPRRSRTSNAPPASKRAPGAPQSKRTPPKKGT